LTNLDRCGKIAAVRFVGVSQDAPYLCNEVIPMAKCERCGKGPQFGHNVSFSKRHTNRQFRPSVMKRTVMINGEPRRMVLCAQCLKTLHKMPR
jgi:large subunit ribosomal protein L28